jgi:hypothetical protein
VIEFTYDDYFDSDEDESAPAERVAPYVKGSETSKLAAESLTTRRDDAKRVWDVYGTGDFTRDEVVVTLDETRYNTWTARASDLCDAGCLIETGERRKTRRGRYADVLTRVPGGTFEQFEAMLRGDRPRILNRRKWLKSLEQAVIRWAWDATPENEAEVRRLVLEARSIHPEPKV